MKQLKGRMFGMVGCGLAVIALVVMISASAFADTGKTKIRMGYIADYLGTSVAAIATKLNLWEKHGLDAELKRFTNGPIQVQALGADSLDFAYIGAGALWLPASGKAKVVAINVLGMADRVIAQPGIKTLKDLKGKKVGMPEGTSGDMLLRLALEREGMTLDDIQVVKMDPSTVVTAFASRQVDAAAIWYPFVQVIRKRIPKLNELVTNEDFFPDVAFPSCFIVGGKMAQNKEVIKKVNAVIKEAGDYRRDHFDEAVKITAAFLNVPAEPLAAEAKRAKMPSSKELVELTRTKKVDGWLNTLADLYTKFGKIKNPLPASQFYLSDLYTE